jgi:hypothetical protein
MQDNDGKEEAETSQATQSPYRIYLHPRAQQLVTTLRVRAQGQTSSQ